KYSAMRSVCHGEPSLGQAIGDCACDGGLGNFHSLVQLVTVGHTLTLSPTLVVDGNVGYTRMSEYGQTPDFGTNIGLDVLGIPGTNNPPDLRSSGMPFFSINGYADMGNPEGWNPAYRNDWSFTSSHNVRWSHGKHQVSAGTDIIHHHLNHWQPELGSGPRGELDFNGGTTALNGGPAANQFNAWAQFLLGMRSEEHTSELQSHLNLVCRLLLEKKKKRTYYMKRVGNNRDAVYNTHICLCNQECHETRINET